MILAGDVGGTKTLLGLFDPVAPRPCPLRVHSFATLAFDDLPSMIAAFLETVDRKTSTIDRACFGVAGPVVGRQATLTNVPRHIDAGNVAGRFGLDHVWLLNDLEAMAYAVPVLEAPELHVLQDGAAVPGGNMALIAAGTGLGEALLHFVDGRFIPSPTEGGHADFAARTEREVVLMKDVTARRGRAEVEQILSGQGFVHIHRALYGPTCAAGVHFDDADAPAAITAAAVEGRCHGCSGTLEVFIEAYGAEAGNLALRSVSTGGLFIGGGIAPKILPALTSGAFMRAFRSKAPLESLVERMPVKVILNPEAGLLGAAAYAASVR